MSGSWFENLRKLSAAGFSKGLFARRRFDPSPEGRIGPADPRFWQSPWKGFALIVAAILAAGAAVLVFSLMFIGPRMRDQPHIGPYQARMPLAPSGAVPVVDVTPSLPTTQAARTLRNPLPATKENLAAGRVYYEYYCLFCHGEAGDGHGPVGESYVPVPTDLRSDKVRRYSDGELLRAMLVGTGHEPVLNDVVNPRHRWHLVLYVRLLPIP